ncbi:hypothetical protein DL96DRAFT_423383 [Flagelloscypha sp. PMI_526]|nr:hypothetical protein DL96DRAFT_423383 [Flagelloscypha sp. PMI_526]
MAHSTRGYNSIQGEAGASIYSTSPSSHGHTRTSRWPPSQSRPSCDATDSSDTDSDNDSWFNNRPYNRHTSQPSPTDRIIIPPLASRASVEVINYSMLKLALSPRRTSEEQHEATHNALFNAARDMIEGTPPFEGDQPLPVYVPTLEIGSSHDFEAAHALCPDIAFGVVHAIEKAITTFGIFPEVDISIVDRLDCTDAFSECVSQQIIRQSGSSPLTIRKLIWRGSYLSCILCLRAVPKLTNLMLELSSDVGPHMCRTLFMLCPQLEAVKIMGGTAENMKGVSGEIREDLKNSMSLLPPVEARAIKELEVVGSGAISFLRGIIAPKLMFLTIRFGRKVPLDCGNDELVDSILCLGIRSRLSRLTIENRTDIAELNEIVSHKLHMHPQVFRGEGEEEEQVPCAAVFVS